METNSRLIVLYLDNNVWDLLYEYQIDLDKELPSSEFTLLMTREAEFEIPPIADDQKRAYIERFIGKGRIRTASYFGFYDASLPPHEQRVAGFGDANDPEVGGRFIEESEAELLRREGKSIGSSKRPKTGLFKHEADVSLAARSLHSAVLTCDGRAVLKRTRDNHGGLIIDLKKYVKGSSLSGFIKSELSLKRSNA